MCFVAVMMTSNESVGISLVSSVFLHPSFSLLVATEQNCGLLLGLFHRRSRKPQ